MNIKRLNEYRKHKRRIEAKYGSGVEVCDCASFWTITTKTYNPFKGFNEYKTLWTGAKLSEA